MANTWCNYCDFSSGLQTLRCNVDTGTSSGYCGGYINCNARYTAILGGTYNTNCNNYSTILQGHANLIQQEPVLQPCGANNHHTISNGYRNYILWDPGFYMRNNTITNGTWSSISGGYGNTISGGSNNSITGLVYSTIGGGGQNVVACDASGIFTGYANSIFGHASVIAGGSSNIVGTQSCFGAIVGGAANNIGASCFGFIGGGCDNKMPLISDTIPTCFNAIGGGLNNTISAKYSFIGSGRDHMICGDYSAIVSGAANTAFSDSFIGSGRQNIAYGPCSAIVSGMSNIACNESFIGSGLFNCARGASSVIGGGFCHCNFGAYSMVGGGLCNSISTSSTYGFIGGGICNTIVESCDSVIGGGLQNAIWPNSCNSVIGGGEKNHIGPTMTNAGTQGSKYGAILGGLNNIIYTDYLDSSNYNIIGGGAFNAIRPKSCNSAILGGLNNEISLWACNSFIGGGGGSFGNKIWFCTDHSAIVGGEKNIIGGNNCNSCSTRFGFIGGGFCNTIDANDTHSNCYNVIGGGFCNCICANTCFSAILGGCGNTISHNYAGIFGGGLVSCSNDTFHASCLNVVNTPNVGGGAWPTGTYVWKAGNLIGSGDKVLVMI